MTESLTTLIRSFDNFGDIGETYDGVICAALLAGLFVAAITTWNPRIGALAFVAAQPLAWVVFSLLGIIIPTSAAIIFFVFSIGTLTFFALPGCLLRAFFFKQPNDT